MRYLSVAEISAQTGASPRTVRWWISRQWLRATITPRGYRVDPDDLSRMGEQRAEQLRPDRWGQDRQ